MSGYLPKILDLGVGGSSGYRVFYDGDRLVWQLTSAAGDVLAEETLQATESDWREFWRALEAAGVWNWEAYYEPEYPTCGGSQWGAWIEHEGRVLRASGRDAWPRGFERYLEAVEKLIGGRPFG